MRGGIPNKIVLFA